MIEKNFSIINHDDITCEHIIMVMKALGKFHALSFAMKDQEPKKFQKMVKKLHEVFFVSDSPIAAHVNQAGNMAIASIDDSDDAMLLRAILRLYELNQFDQLTELISSDEAEPYAVILHGDLWSSENTIFKPVPFR